MHEIYVGVVGVQMFFLFGRCFRFRRICYFSVMFLVVEVSLRFFLGLGNPPLSIADPDIEYYFAPNQDVSRFGNRFQTNQFGMRSRPLSVVPGPFERRLLVFGDSVVNGGVLTDQSELATTIFERSLESYEGGAVFVGNVSAGSWGPGNWLAYAERFGFFGADTLFLVISAHDLADVPSFEPLDPNTHPVRRPLSATSELIGRYVLPRLWRPGPAMTDASRGASGSGHGIEDSRQSDATEDLRRFLKLASGDGRYLCVFYHPELKEQFSRSFRLELIRGLVVESGGVFYDLSRFYDEGGDWSDLYRDNIHPSVLGQQRIANAFLEAFSQMALPRF